MSPLRRVVLRCALGAAASALALLVATPALADAFVPGPPPVAPTTAPPPPAAPSPDTIVDDAVAPGPAPATGARVGSSATARVPDGTGRSRTMRLPLRAIAAHVASGEAGTAATLLAALAGLLAAGVVTLAAERLRDALPDALGSGGA